MPDSAPLSLGFTALGGAGEELLVLGPSLGTAVGTLWGATLPALGGAHEVVGWDLPGHGRSAPTTDPFTVEDLAASVRDFVAEHAAGRRVRYAGVSIGGAVGFTLALDPGQVADVVTLASAPRIGEPSGWADRAALVRRGGTSAVVEGSAQRWFAPGFVERQPQVASRLLDQLVEVDDESYALACGALAAFDVRSQLSGARVPLLAVAGEHDAVVSPEALRGVVPDAVVLPGVAHLPPAEDPRAVTDLLEDRWATTRG